MTDRHHHSHPHVHGAGASHGCGHHHATAAETETLVKDPVCGMSVDPAKTQHHADHAGTPITSAPRAAARSSRPTPSAI